MSTKTLVVKKSSLPGAGLGLFAKIPFRKGDRITEYKGRHVPWKDVKDEDATNDYLLRLNRTTAIDAKSYLKSPGRYANDAKGFGKKTGLHNNADYIIYGNKVFIEAIRNVAAGDEIFVDYGREFWLIHKRHKSEKLKVKN